jgi:hypothetical protein
VSVVTKAAIETVDQTRHRYALDNTEGTPPPVAISARAENRDRTLGKCK